MTETEAEVGGITRDLLEARVAASPAWLAERRRLAWAAYTELPFPSSARDEDWRRTPINRLPLDSFSPAVAHEPATLESARGRRDRGAPNATLVVAAPQAAPLIEDVDALAAQGVIVESLARAAHTHPELVERGLAAIAPGESKFTALWNALWHDGVFIYVPREITAMAPVWISHLAGAGGLSFPALVAVLDDGARLTLIEDHVSPPGEAHAAIAVGATTLGAEAELEHVTLQDWSDAAWHIGLLRSRQEHASHLRLFGASLGAHLQKSWWETQLDGDGAEADINAIALADSDRHLDHQSLQAHRAPDTRSRLLLKAAARDTARSVYGGLIDVEPQAVHADGYVANRNLLLSRGARASGIPRLEIRANDVRCGHGATVGHVDADERFYLESRGVPREEAERIIVQGFYADVIDRITVPSVREFITELVDASLGGGA